MQGLQAEVYETVKQGSASAYQKAAGKAGGIKKWRKHLTFPALHTWQDYQYNGNKEPSPHPDEYAPVIFTQETVSYLDLIDVMSNKVKVFSFMHYSS